MAIRLVGIDIDGTLLDSRGRLPGDNRVAVAAAVERGVEVVLVTGRSYAFAVQAAADLQIPATLIVSNGAAVKAPDGQTLLSWPLPRAVACEVLAATPDFHGDLGIVFDLPGGSRTIYERIDWTHPNRAAYFARNREWIGEASPLALALDADPLACVFNGSLERMHDLHARLAGLPLSASLELALTEYAARDFALVDVLTRGCGKGPTLLSWARERGVAARDVMAIGDNLNDADMLARVGVPVVMGNAVSALRDRGWFVTASHDEAGVARALERFVLEGRRG